MPGFRTLFLDLKFSPHIGGTATMFKYRMQLYSPENVIVLTRTNNASDSFDNTVKYKIIRKPFKIISLKGFEWVSSALLLVIESLKLLRKSNFDFIEAARPFPEGVAVLILRFLTRKKTIVNFHGEDIAVMSNYRVEKIVLQLISRFSHVIMCNSSFTASLLQKLFPKCFKKVHIVYPGFAPIPKNSLDEKRIETTRKTFDGNPVLVTVARIAERKGHDMVIKALPALIDHFPNLKYVIAGSFDPGEGENAVNRLKTIATKLGITSHIKYVTNFSDDERPYLIAASDVFVMPNRALSTGEVEGFGISFLEASSLGLPVIGGNSGGVVDAVKNNETGILVDGNSKEEIAAALKSILNDKDYHRQLGTSGIAFSSNMDYFNSFKKYQEILEHSV
jgi:phosphatidylinositol alpha-1,6-mannosyltransferase